MSNKQPMTGFTMNPSFFHTSIPWRTSFPIGSMTYGMNEGAIKERMCLEKCLR
jgi:hypothetical protein